MKKLPLLFFSTILLFSCIGKKSEKEISQNNEDNYYCVECNENTARYSCMLEDCIGLSYYDEKLYSTENKTISYILYNDDKTKVELFLPDGACNILDKIEENIYQQKGGYYRLVIKNGHQLFYKNKLIYKNNI